jgi:hypothetical protein
MMPEGISNDGDEDILQEDEGLEPDDISEVSDEGDDE